MSSLRSRIRTSYRLAVIGLTVFALGLVLAIPTQAQTVREIFFVKFVCGFEVGNIPLLSDPDPLHTAVYEDFKPGNYAAAVNIINLNMTPQTVDVAAVITTDVPGIPSILSILPSRTLGLLVADKIDCIDIANATPGANGGILEGYLLLLTMNPNFKVHGVQTYAVQNAFERHVVWTLDQFGVVTRAFQELNQTLGTIFGTLPPVIFETPERTIDIAASGAGGLGLGASIEIEEVESMTVTLPSVPDPGPLGSEALLELLRSGS